MALCGLCLKNTAQKLPDKHCACFPLHDLSLGLKNGHQNTLHGSSSHPIRRRPLFSLHPHKRECEEIHSMLRVCRHKESHESPEERIRNIFGGNITQYRWRVDMVLCSVGTRSCEQNSSHHPREQVHFLSVLISVHLVLNGPLPKSLLAE